MLWWSASAFSSLECDDPSLLKPDNPGCHLVSRYEDMSAHIQMLILEAIGLLPSRQLQGMANVSAGP